MSLSSWSRFWQQVWDPQPKADPDHKLMKTYEQVEEGSASPGPSEMHWRVSLACSIPKTGEQDGDDRILVDPKTGLFAVSDGAGQSLYSGLWAELLLSSLGSSLPFFAEEQEPASLDAWLEPLSKRWREMVAGLMPEPRWYERGKLQSGGHATLVALLVSRAGTWRAIAAGDSCLFQVRDEALVAAFPVEAATEFPKFPELIGSNLAYNHDRDLRLLHSAGTYQPGDVFFLASDALSRLALSRQQEGAPMWGELAGITSAAEFEEFVSAGRKDGLIENDDTSITVLQMSSHA